MNTSPINTNTGAKIATGIALLALSGVLQAQTTAPVEKTTTTTTVTTVEKAAPKPKMKASESVELRIKELHAKLMIKPSQEALWSNVTDTMRDNAATMDQLREERLDHAASATAIDDLKSYSEITDAHADGQKKFIPVFEDLYNAMSPAQKKNADALFRKQARENAAAKG